METLSERLLLEHAEFVRALARRLVRDEHAAEDVAQATLLAALEKPPPRRANVRGWLAAVTRNLAARWGRGEARRTRRELSARQPAAARDPGDAVARIELQQLVVAEVLALEAKDRDVIVARYFEGLAPAALAQRLGIPVETARTRLRRAVDRLRAGLDARHGGDRRAWSVALLSLAGLRRTSAATGAAVAGVVVMTVKQKIALVIGLLLAAGAGIVTVRHVSRSTSPPAKTRAAARALPPLAGKAEPVRESEPEATPPATPAPRRDHAYKTWGNVPGATVALQLRYYGGTPDPEPIERVADEDGYAGFEPPPRDEPLYDASLRIRADGYLTQARDVKGETTRYELAALSQVVSVRGRVVDESGAPIEGARVGATRSDAEGCYRLLAYKPGPQRITVKHPEFLPVKRTVTAPSDGVDFVLRRGLSVSGRIVARDGTPLPGISVKTDRDHAWSGSDGRFWFSGLEPGDVALRVHVRNAAIPGASGQSWRVMTVEAGDPEVEFRITEPVVLLRVVDDAGLPFRHAKAAVHLSAERSGLQYTAWLRESGAATLPMQFGATVHLTAIAPGYAPAELEFDTGDRPVREVVLTLRHPEATGALEIHATDMDRRPRSFVLLTLTTKSGALVEEYNDKRIPLDEDGRARVEGLAPGRYQARVGAVPSFRSVSGYGLPCRLDVEVRPREASPVEARIADGGRIRVTVRNAAGEVAPPGSLELHWATGGRHYRLFTVEKEGPGLIRVSDHTTPVPLITAQPLEPGRYRVVMKRGGRKVTEGEIEVEAGKTADLVLHVDE